MRDGLTPQIKADKNGRLVKRWVKSEQQAKRKSLPLVPVAPNVNRDEFCQRMSIVTGVMTSPVDIRGLSDNSVMVLDGLLDTIGRNPHDQACLTVWVGTYAKYEDDYDQEISLVAAYHRMDEGVALADTLRYVRGLYAYEDRGFSHDQIQSLIDTSVVINETMLMGYPANNLDEAFHSFFDGDFTSERKDEYWIKDESFISLVTRRTKDVPAILALVKERQIYDAEVIEEILDTGSHSVLLEGSL